MGRRVGVCTLLLLVALASHAQIGADGPWVECERTSRTGDWAGAAAGWQKLLATTGWPYHHMRDEAELALATAERHLAKNDLAQPRLAALLTRHRHDEYTPRILAQMSLLPGVEQAVAMERSLAYLLDAHGIPEDRTLDAFYAAMHVELGAGKPVCLALALYLDTHPAHPALLRLRLKLARWTIADGRHDEGARQLLLLRDEAVGAPESKEIVLALGDVLLLDGKADEAAKCLAPYAAFTVDDPGLTQRLLTAYRQAGDAVNFGKIIDRLLKRQADLENLFDPASWLFTTAVDAHDKPRAQHWLDALNTIAPEHPFAAHARKELKEWK